MRVYQPLRRRIAFGKRVIKRRWYLTVAILLLMFPILLMASQAVGVYYSKADVLILPPTLTASGNALQVDATETLAFSAAVVAKYNDTADAVPRSTSAPLYGSGIRRGHLVYIPSSGGQWQMSYGRPVITLEVVGESAAEVAHQRDEIVKDLALLTESMQRELRIVDSARITTQIAPGTAFVDYMEVRRTKALIALGLLTIGLALGVPLSADRIIFQILARSRLRKNPADFDLTQKISTAPDLPNYSTNPMLFRNHGEYNRRK